LRLIDSCITQLEAQGPSRTCDESKEDEEKVCCGADGDGLRRTVEYEDFAPPQFQGVT